MIFIDSESVHRLATAGSLVDTMRRAFGSNAVSPERTHFDLGEDSKRTLLLMPSWRTGGPIGVKVTTVFQGNAALNIPTVNAAYLLLSGQSGQPIAVIDGTALTLVRTAAVSALAADLLAPAHPQSLLMVGTGALSRHLIEGHAAVRRYESIRVWGRDPHKAAAVASGLAAKGLPVAVAHDLETAVRSSDVISCATLAARPLIEGRWLKSDVHLDLVGSFTPAMREADDECMRNAFITVDTLGGLNETGDLIDPVRAGVLQIGKITLLNDLVTVAAPRARAGKTVFKSVGIAHADLAAAEEIYARRQTGSCTGSTHPRGT